MKYPFISVVIPAHNEEDFIARPLKSLKNQDYKGRYEIIVVDNASKDNTAKIARKYGAKVIFEPKKGVQYARQAGFVKAKGEFIASTDADDILPCDWLSKMSTRLAINGELAAVCGWFRHETGPIIPRLLVNYFSGISVIIYKILSRKEFLVGQNFIVRKSVFLKTQGFRGLEAFGEDVSFAQRAAKYGKIEFHCSRHWSVVTSHRRWAKGFFAGLLPYILGSFTFAIWGKVVAKGFKDIRTEKSNGGLLRFQPIYSIFLALLILVFAVPAGEVNAKIAPATEKAKERIVSEIKETRKYISKSTDTIKPKINNYFSK